MFLELLEAFFVLVWVLMLAYLVRHYIFTITVLRKANSHLPAAASDQKFEPSVTILIPARNEEKVIGRILQRMNELTYPKNKLQVIVIDDASTDETGKIASRFCRQYPYVNLIQRDAITGGKGKAAAMNDGFSKATGEITLCFDADYYPQRDIVERLVCAFVNPKVGAVQGRVVVLNEPQNTLTRLVALERIGGYRVDQEARDILGLIAQFGGTVGGFRTSILRNLDGWDGSVLAEDTDLTFRIYLAGYTVKYQVTAECYEEAVDTWRAYWRQRYRWAKGHMLCFFKHSWPVLKSNRLSVKQKIDGLMLLNVYFMPVIVFFSFLVGLFLIASGVTSFSGVFWALIAVSFYSFVGNFAPFFEVGVGLYLDGRKRAQWLIPLSAVTFIYNIPLCGLAFLDVVWGKITKKGVPVWAKTVHSGNGAHFVLNNLSLGVDACGD